MLPVAPPAAVTKPSMPPLFHDRWLEFHDWLAPSSTSHVWVALKTVAWPPLPSGLLLVGTPPTEREAVTAAEHAEVVVVGVVLLHVDHDVLDLRQEVGALGLGRVGPGAGRQHQAVPRRAAPGGYPAHHRERGSRPDPLQDATTTDV